MRARIDVLIAVVLLAGLFHGCSPAGFLSSDREPARSAQPPNLRNVSLVQGGLLVRGTAPVRGLPGFGRNAIPALTGTYLVQSRDRSPPVVVQVWISQEWLYFKSGLWTAETPLGGVVLRQWRQEIKLQIQGMEQFKSENMGESQRDESQRGKSQSGESQKQGIGVLRAFELKAIGPGGSRWTLLVLELSSPMERAAVDTTSVDVLSAYVMKENITPADVVGAETAGTDAPGTNAADKETSALLGRFYQNLLSRLSYFLESARRVEDVSLPALVGL